VISFGLDTTDVDPHRLVTHKRTIPG